MLNRESSHNLFRFLQTRDVNLNTLEGVLFDFCCNLHPYSLNREAKDFEFVISLVDGCHWAGNRKMKRPDKNAKGQNGHMSCSEGYNFNIYKDKINYSVNSQSREQMHAKLEFKTENIPRFLRLDDSIFCHK